MRLAAVRPAHAEPTTHHRPRTCACTSSSQPTLKGDGSTPAPLLASCLSHLRIRPSVPSAWLAWGRAIVSVSVSMGFSVGVGVGVARLLDTLLIVLQIREHRDEDSRPCALPGSCRRAICGRRGGRGHGDGRRGGRGRRRRRGRGARLHVQNDVPQSGRVVAAQLWADDAQNGDEDLQLRFAEAMDKTADELI